MPLKRGEPGSHILYCLQRLSSISGFQDPMQTAHWFINFVFKCSISRFNCFNCKHFQQGEGTSLVGAFSEYSTSFYIDVQIVELYRWLVLPAGMVECLAQWRRSPDQEITSPCLLLPPGCCWSPVCGPLSICLSPRCYRATALREAGIKTR